MSRMAKKYSSSRYSQTSARRNSSHPRGGSIRTTAGAPACNCVGVPDCEGAVTVAIKLCAATFARGPMKSNLDYQNSSQRAETAPWSAAVLFILSLEGPRFCSRCHTTRLRRSTNLTNRSTPPDATPRDSRRGLFFHLVDVAVFNLAH